MRADRLSSSVRSCLVTWVRAVPGLRKDSDCGRVHVAGDYLFWRGDILALRARDEVGAPKVRLWQGSGRTGQRRAIEREVLRLFPGALVHGRGT